jgi:hypothetical protein
MSQTEKPILSYYGENKSQLSKDLPDINNQEIKYTCPVLMVNDAQVDKSSQEVFDQQSLLDNTQDEKHQSSISIPDLKDFPTVKEVGIQTEPPFSTSMANIDQKHKSIAMTDSNQSTKYVPTSTIRKKMRTCIWPSKYHLQILEDISSTATSIIDKQYKFWSRFRVNNSFTYDFTKFMLSIVLATIITYHLLTGSIFTDKDANSMTLTNLHMLSIDEIRQSVIAILIATVLSFSSILNGPSRSLLELWCYPFAVP